MKKETTQNLNKITKLNLYLPRKTGFFEFYRKNRILPEKLNFIDKTGFLSTKIEFLSTKIGLVELPTVHFKYLCGSRSEVTKV